MKKIHVLTAVAAAAFLAGCGGSDPGNQTPTVKYTRMVNFGDSLSDVGTYRTALVAANGEGRYSINGDLSKAGLPYTNWTQYLAAALQLAQPCAAETGLDSPTLAEGGQLFFMYEAPTFHDESNGGTCHSYAQGGARVTNPLGPANRGFWDTLHSSSGWLGQLTIPVKDQITNFTTNVGAFTSGDLVTVMAGGNDLFVDRGLLVDVAVGTVVATGALGTQAGTDQITAAEDTAVNAMAQAGTELAALVLDQIVAGGATHVVVVNLPDVNATPDAQKVWMVTGAGAVANPIYQAYKHTDLTLAMVQAFNGALATGLGVDPATGVSSHAEVLYVDAFTASDQQIATPATFGLTNVTDWACDPAKTGLVLPDGTPVPIPGSATAEPTSLFCTKDTLVSDPANVTATDPSGVLHYQFADAVHPTPYGYRLLSELVIADLAGKGWL